jgi:hypothetical protein
MEDPMPTPLEICLEETQLPPDDERYIRCVALPGSEPGLALDREGAVRWMPDGPAAYGLWVSADDQLILLRAQGAEPITVQRAGRSLEAPAEMPVVLRDQDLLRIDGRELRVHVHGATHEVHPPERLSRRSLAQAVRATAAALALGAAVGAGSAAAQPIGVDPLPIEVRAQPPKMAAPERPVTCDITSMTAGKKVTTVHARCPAGPVPPVGSRGQLMNAQGALIPDGELEVKQVNGSMIVGETKQRGVKATKVRFYVR